MKKRIIQHANGKWGAQRRAVWFLRWTYLSKDKDYYVWRGWEYVVRYCLVDSREEAIELIKAIDDFIIYRENVEWP